MMTLLAALKKQREAFLKLIDEAACKIRANNQRMRAELLARIEQLKRGGIIDLDASGVTDDNKKLRLALRIAERKIRLLQRSNGRLKRELRESQRREHAQRYLSSEGRERRP